MKHFVFVVEGIKCGLYHAGLHLRVRKETHRKFVHDDIQVGTYKHDHKLLVRDLPYQIGVTLHDPTDFYGS